MSAKQKTQSNENKIKAANKKIRRVRAIRRKQLTYFMSVVVIAGVVLYNNMLVTSLTRDISQEQQKLADLQSTYVSLKTQQDRAFSLGYVETYAQDELGMVKVDNTQIEYIEIENPDTIESSQSTTALSEIMSGLSKSFAAILEYIK